MTRETLNVMNMEIRPGPAGSVLIYLGGNKRGDVGIFNFPVEKVVTYLEPELFGETDPFEISTLLWSETSQRILAPHQHIGEIRTLTADFVLALPRHHAKTGKKMKNSSR